MARERVVEAGGPDLEKEAWVSADPARVGLVRQARLRRRHARRLRACTPRRRTCRGRWRSRPPRSAPTRLLLTTAHVVPAFAGGGLGRMLVQGVAQDLTKRGVKAIEAFGDAKWDGPHCVVPVDFLLSVGFKTVRPHPRYPRLRLELRTALSLEVRRRVRAGEAARLDEPADRAGPGDPLHAAPRVTVNAVFPCTARRRFPVPTSARPITPRRCRTSQKEELIL